MAEERMYYSYSEYLKEKYGEKVYKLPVNLPVSCPNRREGRGCTFCAEEGTGFESADARISVREQLRSSREKVEKRYHAKKYIAYFQNYTNTFLPLPELLGYLEEAAFLHYLHQLPLPGREELLAAFDRAQALYASHGITVVQEGLFTPQLIRPYQDLLRRGGLYLHVVGYAAPEDFSAVAAALPRCVGQFHRRL